MAVLGGHFKEVQEKMDAIGRAKIEEHERMLEHKASFSGYRDILASQEREPSPKLGDRRIRYTGTPDEYPRQYTSEVYCKMGGA